MDQTEAEDKVVFRDKWREATDPYVDLLDRKHLHSVAPMSFMRWFVTAGMPLDKIPGEFWNRSADDEGFTVANVACPCSATPKVDAGGWLNCDGCERGYLFTGTEVFVINSQRSRPEAPAPAAS